MICNTAERRDHVAWRIRHRWKESHPEELLQHVEYEVDGCAVVSFGRIIGKGFDSKVRCVAVKCDDRASDDELIELFGKALEVAKPVKLFEEMPWDSLMYP